MLKGKVAIVTGASRGIGRAIALKMAHEGASVALIYAGNATAADEVCGMIRALGVQAEALCCDVSDYSAMQEAVKAVLQNFGGFDILVNNAGITRDGLLLSMTEENFDAVLNTNLKGAFNMIKHTLPHFLKKRSGRIINISSVSGLMGNPGQANYAAAKAGLIGLTKTVAKEVASRSITCNAIAPGFIKTDMTDALPEQVQKAILDTVPIKRMGTTDEIAAAAVFLSGPDAGYITGAVLRVDGGLAM